MLIAHAPCDGSLRIFEDFEQEDDGHLRVVGVVESEWTTFYGLEGERMDPELGQHDWVERLVPSGTRDLSTLVQVLSEYARHHQFESDGTDPGAFVNELARRR